jgi:tetratricopeptide (TPR) repeat protein
VKVARKSGLVLALVLGFGAVRVPIERSFDRDRRAAGLRDDIDVRLSVREQVNQAALFAMLGGLRSLVAAVWDLWARDAWSKTNYGEVEQDYRFMQQLQPRVFYYWDMGQWMMAYNAASYYRFRNRERRGLDDLLYDSYVEKGRQMIEDGIRNLPNDWRLYQALAMLYSQRYPTRDYAKIAAAWERAAAQPDAPAFARRFHAYALAQVPGREEEARRRLQQAYDEAPKDRLPGTLLALLAIYEAADVAPTTSDPASLYRRLRAIYDRQFPDTQTPLLMRTLRLLEERLNLPASDRLPAEAERTAGQPPPVRI